MRTFDAEATARSIIAAQRPDGAIPWTPGGAMDPWNHIEAAMGLDAAGRHDEAAAAYRWLAANQNADGSWYAEYRDGEPAKSTVDSNFTAYVATGVRYHLLSRPNADFEHELWPVVDAAMRVVLEMAEPDGQVRWRSGESVALLAGNCSIHHSLRQAIRLAAGRGQRRPDWEAAADRVRAAVLGKPELFEPKPHAMDWYYPVLGSVITGSAAERHIAHDWPRFVQPGHGVRCVHDQPWVTGGETAELALTLAARGRGFLAEDLLDGLERLRYTDGSYWTGYQYANEVIWPEERTTWTAGAILLAHAAISGHRPTLAVFGDDSAA